MYIPESVEVTSVAAPPPAVREGEGYATPNILVIGPGGGARRLRGRLLAEGFPVDWAASARQGLRELQEKTVSLAIVELEMPDMDGFTMLQLLKATMPLPPPVIILSSTHSKEDVMQSLRLGARDFVMYPIDYPILLRKIHRLTQD
ncbi:MAG: response regulator [Nitrospinota bacterium]